MKYFFCICCFCVMTTYMYSQEDVLRPNGRTSSAVGSKSAEGGATSSSTKKSNGLTFALGVEGGIGLNFFSQNIPNVLNGNPEQFRSVFTSGNGVGGYGAIIGDLGFSESIGLQARIGYQTAPFSNSGTIDEMMLTDVSNGQSISSKQDVEWSAHDLQYLTTSLNFRLNITPNLILTVGPTMHFLIGATPYQKTTNSILAPESASFDLDGDPFTQDTSKTISRVSPIESFTNNRLGLELGVSYKLKLNKSWVLLPKVNFQYMFTKLLADDVVDIQGQQVIFANERKLNFLQFGLGLWYYFN